MAQYAIGLDIWVPIFVSAGTCVAG